MKTDCDVTILGGGPAGCAVALMLKKHSTLDVLVVESSHFDSQRAGESIPPDTRLLLKQLGIWEGFIAQQHDPCLGSCSSWGYSELDYNDFIFNPYGHGWHLNRHKFDHLLADSVRQSSVDMRMGAKFINSKFIDGHHLLSLCDIKRRRYSVRSKFVVDATGIRSSFSQKQGSLKKFHDEQVCITAFFKNMTSSDMGQMTLLEAVEYGWWYAAQLPDQLMTVALSCDKSFLKTQSLRKFSHWFAHLVTDTKHIRPKLAGCHYLMDSLRVNSAASFIAEQMAGESWLATGDAASSYDPISAQGIYKALENGIEAAQAVMAYFSGQEKALDSYTTKVENDFQHYLSNRLYLYRQEKRWPESNFWCSRQKRSLGIRPSKN